MEVYAEQALALGARAARTALERSEVDARAITHLVTVSCTGFGAPGLDLRLLEKLGLRRDTERLHVGFMGCHGAVNGLRAARAFASADPAARVLLCAVEVCSIHFTCDTDREKYTGNALFSDGAAALVGGACPGRGPWRLVATGSSVLPGSSEDMTWRIGDRGFEMRLTKRVPRHIREHLRPWFEEWLGRSGLRIGDVGSWAIHPGGPRILSAAEEALGLAPGTAAVSREVLSEHGNMSSPTILFILDRLAARGAPRPCVALGFGPGLVAEAALLV
jgi:predicted naringenin-chalcone synthase